MNRVVMNSGLTPCKRVLSDVISFTELAAKVLPAYMGQMREALKTLIPMADFCRPVSRRPAIKLNPENRLQ
jgi:hypothetical protein